MLVGSSQKPFPRTCPQDCQLGPKYQHGRLSDKVKRYVNTVKVSNWPDGTALFNAPVAPSESLAFRSPSDNSCEPAPDDIMSGPWIGAGQFRFTYANLPTQTFVNPKMLGNVSVASGGTGYVAGDVGKVLTVSGGVLTDSAYHAYIKIAAVAGGKVTQASVVTHGSYLTSPISPNPTMGGTIGTGATFNLTMTDETVDFTVCEKRGFKNVAAVRQWHGCYGFLSHDSGDAYRDLYCPDGSFRQSQQLKPDQERYLTLSTNAKYSLYLYLVDPAGDPPSYGYEINTIYEQSVHVNPNSGETTILSSNPLRESGATNGWNGLSYMINLVKNNISQWKDDPTSLRNALNCDPDNFNPGSDFKFNFSCQFTNTSISVHCDFNYICSGPPGERCYYSIDINQTLSDPNPASSVYADIQWLLGRIMLNDDKLYPFRTDTHVQVAPLVSRNEVGPDVVPTMGPIPATVDDYSSPIGSKPYASWNQRSWFDPNCYEWIFPMVIVNGKLVQGDNTNSIATGLTKICDGSVLGEMKPTGYENYFDWNFLDWRGCQYQTDVGQYKFDWYVYGYGSNVSKYNELTEAQLPLNCTQWTNNHDVIDKSQGASLMYQCAMSYAPCYDTGIAQRIGALWGYKYAVIKENWTAENYYIGGSDKFLYDETSVYSASLVHQTGSGAINIGQGSTWQLADYQGNHPMILLNGIWGGRSVSGFYSGCSYDPGTGIVTLGGLVLNLPSDWDSRSGDGASCFGRLRFPNVPSLKGRVPITVSGKAGKFDSPQTQFGMGTGAPELVDLYDQKRVLLASGVPAPRVDDSNFTLPTAYPTAVWAVSHGAPAWYMDDNYPRGNYVALQWLMDRRTSSESTVPIDCAGTLNPQPNNNGYAPGGWSQTQGCLPFVNCAPRVLCYSPNGEEWENGETFPFPSSFNLDGKYGSAWYGDFQTTMTDLFWQTPHHPVGDIPDVGLDAWTGDTAISSDVIWKQDDGTCEQDSSDVMTGKQTMYYPLAPLVEAEITLPKFGLSNPQTELPPALPAGISLAWLDPATNTTGDVSYAPSFIGFNCGGGTPAEANTEWSLRPTLIADVAEDSTCRFMKDYSQWVLN